MVKVPVSKQPKQTTITGEVSSIKYKNADNWAVFTLAGQSLTFTGTLAEMIEVGSEVTVTGTVENGKFGRQIKCSAIIPAAPDISTDTGVAKLLQRLPGIGPKKAMQAVNQHGHERAWELAQTDPESIGVTATAATAACNIAKELLASYEATVYLLGIGLTDHQAAVIYREYGAETVKIVSANPFLLLDIDGFGFRTVFKIAIKAGMPPGCDAAIYACIKYVLNDGEKNAGNIWLSGWKLCDLVLETITETAIKLEVPLIALPGKDDVRRCCHFMASDGAIIIDKGKVFSKELFQAEQSILGFWGAELA